MGRKAGRRERRFFCLTHCLLPAGIRDPNTVDSVSISSPSPAHLPFQRTQSPSRYAWEVQSKTNSREMNWDWKEQEKIQEHRVWIKIENEDVSIGTRSTKIYKAPHAGVRRGHQWNTATQELDAPPLPLHRAKPAGANHLVEVASRWALYQRAR
jgi:hypothetical protein